MGGGSPGTGPWLRQHRSSCSGCACGGFAGCGHGHSAGVILTVLLPAGTVLVSALPGVATLGIERLWCGRSHNSRKLWALPFFVLNMQVATVSPDYLI